MNTIEEAKEEHNISLTHDEVIEKIKEGIANGEAIRQKVEQLQGEVRYSGNGNGNLMGFMTKSVVYSNNEKREISSEINQWQKGYSATFSITGDGFFLNTSVGFEPSQWKDFKEQGMDFIDSYISSLKSSFELFQFLGDNRENKKDLPNKVLISHSSEDEDFVKALVDLLEFLGVDSEEKLLCSSVTGYRIPLNENICDYIRKQFDEYNLFVIVIHSDNYYDSPYSLNEMGAAWVLKSHIYSFLVKGFPFYKMKGVVNDATIAIKVDSKEAKERLNELQKILLPIFKPQGVDLSRWEEKRDEFLEKVNA